MVLLEGVAKMTAWLGPRGRKSLIAIAIVALFLLNLNVGLAAGSASIGDYVWDDQNGDGEQGSEFDMGINDVELELWLDNNGDGRVSDGDMPLGTTTTDSDGRYLFVGLDPGDYIVKVADSNFASGGPLYDYALTTDSDFLSVHLGEGETYNEADFGYEALASPAPTEPTAVSLSSFMASSGLAGSASRGTSFHWPWLMVFVTLAAGGSLWIRRQ
jgi:hypothetical protein